MRAAINSHTPIIYPGDEIKCEIGMLSKRIRKEVVRRGKGKRDVPRSLHSGKSTSRESTRGDRSRAHARTCTYIETETGLDWTGKMR